ncbi:hypothetical protein Tco_1007495 [Tanacetum coccineum]
MASNKETNAAGTDTRPLCWLKVTTILGRFVYTGSIRGQNPYGKQIWENISRMGDTPHPMITDPHLLILLLCLHQAKNLILNSVKRKTNLRWMDTQVEIILRQRTIQQAKEDLFDEYERFRAIGKRIQFMIFGVSTSL